MGDEKPAPSIQELRAEARAWLEMQAPRRQADQRFEWGVGDDSVAVFLNLTEEEETELVAAGRKWMAARFDAGFGALAWPVELGGRGLPPLAMLAYAQEEGRFDVPRLGELLTVTTGLIAPTIAVFGTPEQQALIPQLLRGDVLACQLFSEPEAGSDLASLQTRAVRDGDDWVITGQKVWTSGALFADIGECICRTDPSASKHAGQTAFLVPLDAPGVEVRPIRQMSGGSSFNEVFLDGVRVPDRARLGAEGDGWKVALTTLANERAASGVAGMSMGGSFDRMIGLAELVGRRQDPVARQSLAATYSRTRILRWTMQRVQATVEGGAMPGPEGSIGKLFWTETMRATSDLVSGLLGPRLVADTGEWGTYAWSEFLLGAPGYRIAGGSDEIQRNLIGERVLGLPREPRPS